MITSLSNSYDAMLSSKGFFFYFFFKRLKTLKLMFTWVKRNKCVFEYKMACFCIYVSALKWPPFALSAEYMASQYSVTSDSASGLCSAMIFFFLLFFSPLNGKERWRHLPTLFLSTRTLIQSFVCS